GFVNRELNAPPVINTITIGCKEFRVGEQVYLALICAALISIAHIYCVCPRCQTSKYVACLVRVPIKGILVVWRRWRRLCNYGNSIIGSCPVINFYGCNCWGR